MRTELEVARRSPDSDWQAVSGNVLDEIDRLQQLVDDLLLIAQMNERGAHAAPYSMHDVVRDVANRSRRVAVSAADAPGEHELVGDGRAVARALDHVVANAARHATNAVSVVLDEHGYELAVHVDDDGPGIPLADRERVLRRFERLDEGRARDSGGSGLGLAVAVDVMAAHGGRVDISDSPLGGARVSLVLPRTHGAI